MAIVSELEHLVHTYICRYALAVALPIGQYVLMLLRSLLSPRALIAVATICSITGVLLAHYPDADTRTFWLLVTCVVYWRVWRGGRVAYSLAAILAAFGAAISSIYLLQQLTQGEPSSPPLLVPTALYWIEVAMLWSRPVTRAVGTRDLRTQP